MPRQRLRGMRMKSMGFKPINAKKLSNLLAGTFLSAFLLVPATVTARSYAATYQNPILETMNMADPHVIKVDGVYYMYPTWDTKQYDVFISDDLVTWKHHGPVYTNKRGGLWAPEVFHNTRGDGKFYLYFTDNLPNSPGSYADKQVGVAVGTSPLGPFEDKAVFATNSIDGHVFPDDDGKLYFYYVHLADGFKIMAQEMTDPVTLKGEAKLMIRPTEAWEKTNGEVTEGPFILKRNDTYYLTYSGTGADSPNYGIGYATSKSPLGPFEKYKGNPIVKRGGDVLGPGHHCVIEGPDKKLWMIYHQKRSDVQSFRRYLAIDPIWFDENGVLHGKATKGTSEPAPFKDSATTSTATTSTNIVNRR